jgi:glycolate oxidase FAD binding subunit
MTALIGQAVRAAGREGAALEILGGGTKRFYGRPPRGTPLPMSGHAGVIDYEPSELVITARSGTRLADIEALLAENGQMLAFEPLDLGPASTLGGVVAAGLAGSRRPFAGAVRDSILGVTLLDGQGRVHRVGGTVFKNVAGFDAFRLMAGALGCLGVLLDISLRVSPRPPGEITVGLEETWPLARERLTTLMRRPLPLTGAVHDGARLHLRLSGSPATLERLAGEIGGERTNGAIWPALRTLALPILQAPRLWRLAVARTASPDALPGPAIRDWAGGQLWLETDAPAEAVRTLARQAGGHAVLFRGARQDEAVFEPLPAPLLALHRRLKATFDPAGVFNPGRMYEGL